jgi:Amt family ammonium transporter
MRFSTCPVDAAARLLPAAGRRRRLPGRAALDPGATTARAQDAAAAAAAAPKVDTGDTAWILVSAALVLLMTPGLALFYGGMVRGKNVLNMLMQSFVAISVVTVVWVLAGYSLAFSPGSPFVGGLAWAG